jgi:hypothetical protein
MSTASACTSTFEARILAQWCIYPAEDRKPVGFSLCQRHSVHQPFQTDAAVGGSREFWEVDFFTLYTELGDLSEPNHIPGQGREFRSCFAPGQFG